MQKTSEIQPISEVFRYPRPTFRRKILKQRGGRKGYTTARGVDCTLARVVNAIVQRFTPIPNLSNHSVGAGLEGTFSIGSPIAPSIVPSDNLTDVVFKSLP